MPVFQNVKNTAVPPRYSGQIGRWLFLLIALLLSLGCRTTWAQTFSCSGISETISVTMPATIVVPRDAIAGTQLTPWISTPATTSYYNCPVTNAGVGPAYKSLLTIVAGMTLNGSTGVAYQVWSTSVPGIGVAIGARAYLLSNKGACGGWYGWITLPANSNYVYQACISHNGSDVMHLGFQMEFAYVKTGAVTPGTTSSNAIVETAWIGQPQSGGPSLQNTLHKFITLTPSIITIAACETPNVSVNMGRHMRAQFSGVGYTTPTVAFDVSINACPANSLTTIQYQFIPVNAVIDANNGLLALDSTSTATGIALQLKDGNDAPLQFNTPYTFAGYNSAAGGSYKVPLKAAYRQMAATVTPGSANAALTFTMTYQ
ncbi:MAG: fimbrial protein [Acidovorax sp.]|jgi:major type 1 subunit fimbrin (pilin)|nr:fimbrial protein [Acidovorax sp.]